MFTVENLEVGKWGRSSPAHAQGSVRVLASDRSVICPALSLCPSLSLPLWIYQYVHLCGLFFFSDFQFYHIYYFTFYSAVNIMWKIFSHSFKYFQKHFQFNCVICYNLISASLLVGVQAGDRFFVCLVTITNRVRPAMGIKFWIVGTVVVSVR